MSLIRLEAAIWDLMGIKQKEEFPAELQSFRLAPSKVGNSQKSQRLASAQTTAKNLWAKRQGWEEEKKKEEEEKEEEEEDINSFQNKSDAMASKKTQLFSPNNKSSSKEKENIKQVNGVGGCLEEFNLLYNKTEASLGEFWNR